MRFLSLSFRFFRFPNLSSSMSSTFHWVSGLSLSSIQFWIKLKTRVWVPDVFQTLWVHTSGDNVTETFNVYFEPIPGSKTWKFQFSEKTLFRCACRRSKMWSFWKNEKISSKKFHLREIKGPKIQLTASNFQIFEIGVGNSNTLKLWNSCNQWGTYQEPMRNLWGTYDGTYEEPVRNL